MNTRFFAALLCVALPIWAAGSVPGTEDAVAPSPPDSGEIEILLAPIALYPDALVALILPASTRPSEIVLAARFLSAGGQESEIEAQSWDDSVKALARFPEVVAFMDENLAWTQDVGDAFVAHPAEVMGAIQALRARGTRNGLLASTPQQEVVFEDDETIRIIPAEPEVIYVPYYEPRYLYPTYSYTYYPSSLLWFGVGYGIGSWLSYDCDWRYRTIWVHHHHHRTHWTRDHDWRRRYNRDWSSHVGGTNWKRWDPSPSYRRSRPRGDYNYSRPVTGITTVRNDHDRRGTEPRRDFSSSPTRDSGPGRRPETLRTPTTVDRNDSTRNRGDSPRDNWSRRDRRPSDSLTRYGETTPVETVTPSRTTPSNTDVQRRNIAPTRRAPDAVDRRPGSIDRRPEIASPAPQRRETPRPSVSSAPPSPPARTITAASQLRHPRPDVSRAPAPAATRSVPQVRQAPSAPAPRTYSAPAAPAPRSYSAPSRQPAPSVSASRGGESRSYQAPPQRAGRNSRVQTEEN